MTKAKEYSHAYYLKHKAEVCERSAAWHKAHKEYCRAKASRWRKEHPDKAKEFCNAYNEKNREKRRLYGIAYRARNKEKCREAYKRYYLENRESRIQSVKDYQKLRPELSRRKRVNRSRASGREYVTERHIKARWLMFGNRCWMCGADATHTDHVKPLSKGGSHWPCNLRPACASCNLRKHSRWIGVDGLESFKRVQ